LTVTTMGVASGLMLSPQACSHWGSFGA